MIGDVPRTDAVPPPKPAVAPGVPILFKPADPELPSAATMPAPVPSQTPPPAVIPAAGAPVSPLFAPPLPGDEPGAVDTPKFKLKPKPAVVPPAVVVETPAVAPAGASDAPLPPPTVAAPPKPIPPSFPVMAPPAPAGLPVSDVAKQAAAFSPPAAAVRAARKSSRRGSMLGLALGGVVVIAAAFFAWRALRAPRATAVVSRPAPVVRSSGLKPNRPAPATPVARPVVAAATPSAGARVPSASPAPAGAAAAPAPAPVNVAGTPRPAPADATTPAKVLELAPGITATEFARGTGASAAFRTFVANLQITGVMSGASPRALINHQLVHVGDVLNEQLGVTFDGINNGRLVFRDKSGATLTRTY